MSNFRVRAYVNGEGEVCCASAVSLFTARADVKSLQRSYTTGLNGVIEKRDNRARTGWRAVENFTSL